VKTKNKSLRERIVVQSDPEVRHRHPAHLGPREIATMAGRAFQFALMTEDQLGQNVRDACEALGWRCLWLRKTFNSSTGILDLLLIPLRGLDHRHILFRELKGHNAAGDLGALTMDQQQTIWDLTAAGGDAAKWDPRDWHSGKILEELK